jgi:hypothetical protein
MAIDDAPSDILIRQVDEEITADSYLPTKLAKLGFRYAIPSLIGLPGIAAILTSFLKSSSTRFERRFLTVCEALSAQQKTIEDKIPDQQYYQSEEFQSLLALIIERLYATHDEAKLRAFGDALANSGSRDFPSEEEKEEFIRILRDLSLKDLRILSDSRLTGWTPHTKQIEYGVEVRSSLSRLAGMGLVLENLQSRPLFADNAAPPKRTYSISSSGDRFLKFIACRKNEEPAEQT